MVWTPGSAPPSTSSTAGWSATPGTGGRASRPPTGSSITNSLLGISTSTIRKRNWAALNRRSSVQVSDWSGRSGRTGRTVERGEMTNILHSRRCRGPAYLLGQRLGLPLLLQARQLPDCSQRPGGRGVYRLCRGELQH